ncbi:MAG: BlaI/MecI/CopY family transcriptional regulator [Planctomycetes bacterium]|nr:BlaI/MecI/CopY family transcriptional regulator [Planctomycetota bacterium]MBL7043338.1 BlaI/MecI/CopY family transcriptional regulator [Pirellulaceae bacterium]
MHKVSETELRMLKVLWDGGGQTARQIAEALYSEGSDGEVGTAEIGTVHSLLGRLEKKKLVRRSRRTHPHRFSAKVTMEDVAGGELEAMAGKLSEGSMAPFVMHLISNGKFTEAEADEIRDMLKNYKPSSE